MVEMKEEKWFYPRRYFVAQDGRDEERHNFHSFLRQLEEQAVIIDRRWEDFYHYTVYTLEDGQVYEYCEDNDYMIPYSITRLKSKNQIYRAQVVEAMDILAKAINSTEICIKWMAEGVADADIDYTKPQDDRLDDINAYCYTEDETFSKLMGTFLEVMSMAREDGGLYADHVLSADWK